MNMKHLLIIGARGFGREVYNTSLESIGYGTEFDVKEFRDNKYNALDRCDGYPKIINSIEKYEVEEGDALCVYMCTW